MWLRNFKIWLVCLCMALISACGSQDSAGSSSANAALQTSSKSANSANTSLLDSLAVLYPDGQMSEQQKALAAKELLQNPTALRMTAPASVSISGQSAFGTLAAQVATGNFGPVFRIQNTTLSGSYFFTIYDFERDSALTLHPEWNLEGTAFYTSRVAAPGLSPVHRFQNKINGSYLYTIYEAERADIVTNYNDFFAYEGVSWYASQTAQAGYTPLYRFRNKVNGTYLFSAYETEKDAIIANYSAIFELEGIAYYVRQSDPLELSLLAGGLGGQGNLDGVGSEARFNNSRGIAVDVSGNTFVADPQNRTIRKISPTGEVTTFAGKLDTSSYVSMDGIGAAARFMAPHSIVVDSMGNLFVTDAGSRTIRKITPAAVVTTFAGNMTTLPSLPSVDGTATSATFRSPQGIAIDSSDNLYVADSGNFTIRKITPAGVVTTIAGDVTGTYSSTAVDGAAMTAKFVSPHDIAVDSASNVYVVDSYMVRKISSTGMVSTLAGVTFGGFGLDGTGAAARFGSPIGIAVNASGDLYVADNLSGAIRKVTQSGVVTTFAGVLRTSYVQNTPLVDGTGAAASFAFPTALTIDASGSLYTSDISTIRKITASATVTTIAGKASQVGATDGTGAAARFGYTGGMVFDTAGDMFVLDRTNSLVRKITQTGVVTTFAGGTPMAYGVTTGDGTGTAATLFYPSGITIDAANNLYLAEQSTIRKITPAAVVTTIAGDRSVFTSTDGTGAAARFAGLTGIAIDSSGNLFATERNRIRKITPDAVVITFAGSSSSGNANGNGIAASFGYLNGIFIDSTNNMYVADASFGQIRKVTATADVTTYAGVGGSGYVDGASTVAKFNFPLGITMDSANNLYVADGNNVIRKITAAGLVSTVVGTAGRKGVVEGLLSGAANLSSPSGVAVYGGKLYISDENSVLKVNGLP